MTVVEIRELRRNPAAVLRDVECGAEVTVLVSGRAVAKIVPIEIPAWVPGERAEQVYGSAVDRSWDNELRTWRQDVVPGARET